MALYAAKGVDDLAASGDAALAANEYDRAIELYSAVIDLDFATDTIFANHIRAKSEQIADIVASGDAAHAANEYDRAIELYSAAIDLDSTTDTIFAKRSKAKSGKMLWDEALIDAHKVR